MGVRGGVAAVRGGGGAVGGLGRRPGAAGRVVGLAVYGPEPPAGRLAVSLMLPEPDAVHVPPPAPTHVQVAVRLAGNVSATIAPLALLGPALLALIV